MFERVMLAFMAGVVAGGLGVLWVLDLDTSAISRAMVVPKGQMDIRRPAVGGSGVPPRRKSASKPM